MKIIARIGLAVVALFLPANALAQATPQVTFAKDIAPILQRSCQQCHRPGSVAPMSLLTYEEARPWARAMKNRTAFRNRRGAMPPWFIEKDLGIQHYKNDPSLTEEEIAKIAIWADSGAPLGDRSDLPSALDFGSADEWSIGTPDLVLESPEIVVPRRGARQVDVARIDSDRADRGPLRRSGRGT